MSGSGGGGGAWNDQPRDDCSALSQSTTLNSPNRAVISQLRKGDLLDVQANKTGKAVIVEALYNGQVAGSITSSVIQFLAECMQKGYKYVAEVIEIKGGACRILVRPK
jgi:hypothetical protein